MLQSSNQVLWIEISKEPELIHLLKNLDAYTSMLQSIKQVLWTSQSKELGWNFEAFAFGSGLMPLLKKLDSYTSMLQSSNQVLGLRSPKNLNLYTS
ncbi:hypothetical protein CEXT_523491 [Caerostris extrusa]|uniref:Uncharacterized protein n=1 Tax=Caerostris extrusa TaxID=172846 RepID=A0AAV4MIT7_CAEEX|nr:hypothetical protein CEXT_523491 [Caerostris extrusa]